MLKDLKTDDIPPKDEPRRYAEIQYTVLTPLETFPLLQLRKGPLCEYSYDTDSENENHQAIHSFRAYMGLQGLTWAYMGIHGHTWAYIGIQIRV